MDWKYLHSYAAAFFVMCALQLFELHSSEAVQDRNISEVEIHLMSSFP